MADKKISALTAATTPLAGSEVLPIVQGASTVKVSVNNLTAGKTVPASALTITAPTYGNSGSIANPNDPNDEVLFTITNGANTNGGIARGGGTVLSLRDRTSNSGSGTVGYGLYVTAPYDGTNASGSTYALTKYGIFVDDIYNFYGQNATVGSTNYGLFVKGGGRNYLKADTQFDNNLIIGTTAKGITTGSAIPLGFGVNNTVTAMTIDTSSNVGIGTTTPAYRLDVKPAAYSAGTALVAAVNINYNAGGGSGNTSCGALTWEGTGSTRLASINPFVEDPSATSRVSMAFSTSNAGGTNLEWMRITSDGRLGLGTTAPAYQLQLSTDSAAKPTSALWTIASDSRIKTETGEYTKGLDAVCALRPVTYHYNGAAGFIDDGKENISIIAQEAMQHFPECVGTFEALLNEGDEEKTELFNWNGHALIFALVNAVKELKASNDALAARVNQLEGN